MVDNYLIIIYRGQSNRCPMPAPDIKIKDFINLLKEDFDSDTNKSFSLFYNNDRLLPSRKIDEYGLKSGAELRLEEIISQDSLSICIQTLAGEQFQYNMNGNATLEDLFSKLLIDQKFLFTKTFPMLFNHRMHLWKSKELLTSYLKLHKRNSESQTNVPDFYLFECQREFETHYLNYQKAGESDLFLAHDFWQPLGCATQNKMAMSIFLISLRVLKIAFLNSSESEIDTMNVNHISKFLLVLRQFLFPPAYLALYHLLEGECFLFEKQLVSEAFFRLFRKILPQSMVKDSDVFLYTPHIFYHIFESTQNSSTKFNFYQSIQILSNIDSDLTSGGARNCNLGGLSPPSPSLAQSLLKTNRFFKKIWGGSALPSPPVAPPLDQTEERINWDFVGQSDLIALLAWMKQQSADGISKNILKNYRIWVPIEENSTISIGNTFEQWSSVSRLTEEEINNIHNQLKQNRIYRQFTFAKLSTFDKTKHNQFVLLKNDHVVYLIEQEKNEDNYKCFDPFGDQLRNTFKKEAIANDDDLNKYPSFPVRESLEDTQLIKQITVLLFDVSSSMTSMVGNQRNNQQSLLDLSSIALGIWCDKIIGYRFSQAIGLIYFGADKITINQKCPISKDLSQLEKASSNLPKCGCTTPMYDAIEMAIQSIVSFRKDNEKQLSSECRSLIVCFSDGEDNSSVKASFGTIKSKLKTEKIVFDTIAFMKHESSNLVQLCETTKGFYYINVPYDKTEMAQLFEREASLMVCLRDEKSHVKIEKPEIRPIEKLYEPAIDVRNANMNLNQVSIMSNRRVFKELDDLKRSSLDNFTVFLTQENSLFWKVIMKGPDDTPYTGYHWLLSVEFSSEFPFKPPNIRFITPIYHCNINDDGRICHDILQSKWTPQTTMRVVFQEILNLIRDPNPDYALSVVKGTQYKSNRLDYEKSIKTLNEKEAKRTISEIMKEYRLNDK